MYNILLFDADRTLYDFDASERAAFFKVMPRFGIKPNQEIYLSYKRFNDENWEALERGEFSKERILIRRFEQFLTSLGLKTDSAQRLNDEYLSALASESFVFEQSLPLLTELKRRNKRIFLITNGVKSVQEGRIALSPLKDFFEKVYISDVLGYEKPSPEFFAAVQADIEGFNKNQALVIGDSLTSDVKGANLCGLKCVWFNPNKSPLPSGYRADYIINSLSELYDIII